MKEEKVWREYTASPELQKQVADFITFLRTRYAPLRASKITKRTKLADEPFIGMWRNREDMRDSSTGVRRIRQSEWTSRHV